jgi:pathogenesis-related protein 1
MMIKQLFLVVAIMGSLTATAYAATDLTATEQTEAVTAHNNWRTKVATPAIKWSSTLADTAQAWANSLKTTQGCKPVHSGATGLGENLFWASALKYSDGTSKVQVITPTQATDAWGNESKDYTYATNTCATGKVCGHYTQVVWKATTEVGCGKAVCADNTQIWVCNYTPAGNVVGQKPY